MGLTGRENVPGSAPPKTQNGMDYIPDSSASKLERQTQFRHEQENKTQTRHRDLRAKLRALGGLRLRSSSAGTDVKGIKARPRQDGQVQQLQESQGLQRQHSLGGLGW